MFDELLENPVNRAQLKELIMDLLRDWALQNLDDGKWTYMNAQVFPLKIMWNVGGMFEALQIVAMEDEVRCVERVVNVAKEMLDCDAGRKLASVTAIKGSVAGTNWLTMDHPFLVPLKEAMSEAAEMEQYDMDVLPTLVRTLAIGSYSVFEATLKQVCAAVNKNGGEVSLLCHPKKSIKGLSRLGDKVKEERAEGKTIGMANVGDVLRATLLTNDANSAMLCIDAVKEKMDVVRLFLPPPPPHHSLA